MSEKKEENNIKEWFDQAQDKYTKFENKILDSLGPIGRFIKKRRSKPKPDWKKVQNIWIWITILAFICGTILAGKYYEFQCNKHIVETFYPEIACINPGFKCNLFDNIPGIKDNRTIQDLPLFKKGEIT